MRAHQDDLLRPVASGLCLWRPQRHISWHLPTPQARISRAEPDTTHKHRRRDIGSGHLLVASGNHVANEVTVKLGGPRDSQNISFVANEVTVKLGGH